LSAAHRFETFLAGSLLLLFGLLLLTYLGGVVALWELLPLFLTGLGVILFVMALWKARVPVAYEMPAKATLAYGVIVFLVGVLWLVLSVQVVIAAYILAIALIFFGLIFLAFTKFRRSG
jgi:uncharacterized membrane protein YesL